MQTFLNFKRFSKHITCTPCFKMTVSLNFYNIPADFADKDRAKLKFKCRKIITVYSVIKKDTSLNKIFQNLQQVVINSITEFHKFKLHF